MVQYWYDAWGNHKVVNSSGVEITDQNHIGNLNPFRYRGYYYDRETGLYFLQTRYYDPEIGRFLNRDSVAYADPETINGLNLYAYCLNNPIAYTDPYGTTEWWEWLTAGVITVALVVGAVVATVATAGTASVLVSVGVSALTGAATSATLSLSSSIVSGELDLGQFTIDSLVGAATGIMTAAVGNVVGAAGKNFLSVLGKMQFGRTTVGSVMGFSTFISGVSKLTEIAGGIISGVYFDNVINKTFNKNETLVQRINNNILGAIQSSIFDFIQYIW